jgi:hypothetical protein
MNFELPTFVMITTKKLLCGIEFMGFQTNNSFGCSVRLSGTFSTWNAPTIAWKIDTWMEGEHVCAAAHATTTTTTSTMKKFPISLFFKISQRNHLAIINHHLRSSTRYFHPQTQFCPLLYQILTLWPT